MDAEGEPGMYMYMHATDYLQNQDVNYKPNFVCARIFYKVEKSLVVVKYFLLQIRTLVYRLKVIYRLAWK